MTRPIYFKIFSLLALLLLGSNLAEATVMHYVTFSPDDIRDKWELFDTETMAPVEFGAIGTDGISITAPVRDTYTLRSKYQYYDVKELTFEYTKPTSSDIVTLDVRAGDISMNQGGDEKNPGSTWEISSGTDPVPGYLEIDIRFQRSRNSSITINIQSIKILCDAEGGKRNLKWPQSSATATLEADFTAPTLSGRSLSGVVYSSSNPAVATISHDGEINIIDEGTATITASCPDEDFWKKDSASFTLNVARPSSYVSETLDITRPGSLKDRLIDLETRPKALKITGKLNSSDIAYLNSGTGKIANVKILDLSDAAFDYDNETYSTIRLGSTGIGMGAISAQFILSEKCHTDTVGSSASLGGASITYKIYNNTLAGAFYANSNYTKVILPRQLPSVGQYIFGESGIQSAVLPDAPVEIEDAAFTYATNIYQLNIPQSVTRIGKSAFLKTNLSSIDLPAACTEIGPGAFNNTKISEISLQYVTSIGESAFSGCTLSEIDLSSLDEISSGAFSGCKLKSVIFSSNLSKIGAGAFNDNRELESIALPYGLYSVGARAFYDCSSLTQITIPETLTEIGYQAFPEDWAKKQAADGPIVYIGNVAYKIATNADPVTELTFRDGTVSISSDLLSNSTDFAGQIRRIKFPESLRQIGCDYDSNSFTGCTNLESVELNDGLLVIGHNAFNNCTKLDIENWPASLEYIGYRAFNNTSIGAVTLGENVKFIGARAFDNCTKLYSIRFNCRHAVGGSDHYYDDPFYAGINEPLFCKAGLEKVTIGSKVEYIPRHFISSCPEAVRVVFEEPDATAPALTVGSSAFSGASQAVFSQLPRRISRVEDYAFYECNFSLEPDLSNCSYFGSMAFAYSSGISDLRLDNNVEFLGNEAFGNIATLTSLYYNVPTVENAIKANRNNSVTPFYGCSQLSSITIGEDVEYIGPYEFNSIPALTNLDFDKRATLARSEAKSLLIDDQAFRSLNIKSVRLPDCRIAIGDYVFANCKYLTTFHTGNGLENVGERAFYFDSSLHSIDFPPSFAAFTGSNVFERCSSLAKLYFHTGQHPSGLAATNLPGATVVYAPAQAVDGYKSQLPGYDVRPLEVSSITFDASQISLKPGEKRLLTIVPSSEPYAGLDLIWSSSDTEIATVDDDGNVTAVGEGDCVVTASFAFIPDITATCAIHVTENAGIDDITDDDQLITITTSQGTISVSGKLDNEILKVYTMQGVCIYSGYNHKVDGLCPGIYIISVANHTAKAIVP